LLLALYLPTLAMVPVLVQHLLPLLQKHLLLLQLPNQ
jgi:hypothetical protein